MTLLSHYSFKGRQEQAATDPNPRIAVTAGAGSGKTLALAARYLHLLEEGYPLRSILAITFTEKAAREMRSRIRAALLPHPTPLPKGEGTDSPPPAGDGLGVRELDSARIGTIHSLCAEILRAHPAEAGLDPAFDVLEEGRAAALQAEAIDSALAWAATDESSAGLFGAFKENDLCEILDALLMRRLDVEAAGADDAERADAPGNEKGKNREHPRNPRRKFFESLLQEYLSNHLDSPAWTDAFAFLAAHCAKTPEDKLELSRQSVLARWDEVRSARAAQNWDEVLAGLTALRKAVSTQGQKANWDDIESVRAAMSELRGTYEEHLKFLAEKARFRLDEQVAVHLPALHRLFHQARTEYQHRKEERQSLDFDDLEGLAAQLLTGHPDVRARLQSELRAVLVDEFQDTNDRQRQIVYTLTRFGLQPEIENRKSEIVNLFVVGDAKQSIYRFRQADVTVFRRVQADIRASGGLSLDLDLTFRAHKGLVETLNGLLAPILGEHDDPARPYAVQFTPLRAYRQSPARENIQPPFVEFHLGLGENAEEGRAAAAQALALRLHQLHENEGFAWGEMALLFRSSAAYAIYEDALEQAGIPFVTVAGRGFYTRPEIRDLLNALAAIADPDDDLALAGLLRSPAFALTDAEIYQLRFPNNAATPAKLIHSIHDVSLETSSSIFRISSLLEELHSLSGRAPAAAVLKRFLDLTNYRAILANAPNGARMIRNVEKLLADAHRSRLVNLNEFLVYVETLRGVGLREGEAPADASTSGAVQLMTVHKAKGLEFPLVVLADTAYEHRGAGGKIQLTNNGLLLDLKDGDLHPAAWQLAARRTDDINDAEDRRLVYVAATRAKEKLLISGHTKINKDGSPRLAGWLERFAIVTGFDQLKISGDMSQPETIPLKMAGCMLNLYPAPSAAADTDSPLPVLTSSADSPLLSGEEAGVRSDLLDPLSESFPVTNEPAQDSPLLGGEVSGVRSDPPQRVWRVVSETKRPRAPAWVVGRLVHEALRRWRFPDETFENFLRPFALEAGLTDPAEIHASVQESHRLLERLRAHPLYAELDPAERHHEVPYFLTAKYPQGEERGIIDLLYRTETGWFIVDFKTDEVRSEEEARTVIREKEYDHQVRRYARAVADRIQVRAKTRLVFMNVENRLVIFDLEENP